MAVQGGGWKRTLFHHANPDAESVVSNPDNINAYLSTAPDVFVWNRSKPLCDIPKIGIGNKPIDGGNYLFKDDEKAAFLAAEPGAERFFHTWLGSDEFLMETRLYPSFRAKRRKHLGVSSAPTWGDSSALGLRMTESAIKTRFPREILR